MFRRSPGHASGSHSLGLAAGAVLVGALLAGSSVAWAQKYPITTQQRTTAAQVAQAGVALSELAPDAPASYTVKRGDTLWAISALFLRSPWRWPELWGMNMPDIRNPHLIYPGQVLVLDTSSGRALLKLKTEGDEPQTVRVSPRTRYESLSESAIPAISMQAIEPFLSEALIVNEAEFVLAPRIVAAQEGRVLLSRGDRAYARSLQGTAGNDALSTNRDRPRNFRIFRSAKPLKDPTTGDVLGYEAQYVGRAHLVRGESLREVPVKEGVVEVEIIPATIDIVSTKEEARAGDRLLSEPSRELQSFVPRAPTDAQNGQVVSVYGSAVTYAGQDQVVVINRGREQGLEPGHVLAVLKDGARIIDRTDANGASIRLPDERNGLMMVFRTFDKLSYALLLQITDGVKVGDRFSTP